MTYSYRVGRSAKTGKFTTIKKSRRYKSTHVVVTIRRKRRR